MFAKNLVHQENAFSFKLGGCELFAENLKMWGKYIYIETPQKLRKYFGLLEIWNGQN